jgi:hypothetical protein
MNPDDFVDFYLKERRKWDKHAIKAERKNAELKKRVKWLESKLMEIKGGTTLTILEDAGLIGCVEKTKKPRRKAKK